MYKPYKIEKLSFLRKTVIASASVSKKKNAIHSFTEIDITKPLAYLAEYKEKYHIKLSFTGYLVACFAEVIKAYPRFNSFISGNRHIILDDIIISVLIERKIKNEFVPEPLVIKTCQNKTYLDIHHEIRDAQAQRDQEFGGLSHSNYLRFIPGGLLRAFVSLADKSKVMAGKYGKLGITSVGMFSKEPIWFISHGSATVLLTIGSIIDRVILIDNKFENRKHLCLTVSFDHDIIDGAPGARFMNDLIQEITCGDIIEKELKQAKSDAIAGEK